jgi:hypothetical protein
MLKRLRANPLARTLLLMDLWLIITLMGTGLLVGGIIGAVVLLAALGVTVLLIIGIVRAVRRDLL